MDSIVQSRDCDAAQPSCAIAGPVSGCIAEHSADEKSLRLDLAAIQRACIEDLLKYTYFIEA